MGGCVGKLNTSHDYRESGGELYSASAETAAYHGADSTHSSPRHVPAALQDLPQRRAGMTASPDSGAPRSRTVLSDPECQLGGYLFARHTLGQPVEGGDLSRLRSGNETVTETRRALRYGRGNVRDDIRDSNGECSIRAEVGRSLVKGLPSNVSVGVRRAAGAMTAQAGNCSEHAGVATFLHAAKLAEGEQVYCVGHNHVDHSWAELRGENSPREHHVVIDPWGKGPAIFAEDSAFAANAHDIETKYHYDHTTGAHAHVEMQAVQRKQQRRMEKQLRREMKKFGPDFRYADDGLYHPMPVVSDNFAYRAAVQMQHGPHPDLMAPSDESGMQLSAEQVFDAEQWMAPLRQEVQATEIARTLGADGVYAVARAASRIADVAADLYGYSMDSHPAQYGHENF